MNSSPFRVAISIKYADLQSEDALSAIRDLFDIRWPEARSLFESAKLNEVDQRVASGLPEDRMWVLIDKLRAALAFNGDVVVYMRDQPLGPVERGGVKAEEANVPQRESAYDLLVKAAHAALDEGNHRLTHEIASVLMSC
jgi:hypothetical protein